jgi:hypothetical protein
MTSSLRTLEKRFKPWQVILNASYLITLSFLCTGSWREAFYRGLQHGTIQSEPLH